MTATPVNNSIRDLYHQLMLFARHTAHFAPLGIPDLNEYFRAAEQAAAHGDSASAMFKLIDATSVRRTRRFIQKHYPNAQTRRQADRVPRGAAEDNPLRPRRRLSGAVRARRARDRRASRLRAIGPTTSDSTESRTGAPDDRRAAAHRPPQAVRVERARLPPDRREDDRSTMTPSCSRSTPDGCSSRGRGAREGREAEDPAALATSSV